MLIFVLSVWAISSIANALVLSGFTLYEHYKADDPKQSDNKSKVRVAVMQTQPKEVDLLEDRYADWDQRWQESQRRSQL